MTDSIRDQVRVRAGGRCEYCQLQEVDDAYSFHVEHVVPRKHGGRTVLSNLAFACHQCNLHKGSNLAGIDPKTNVMVELFDPRRHVWGEHFRTSGARIQGLSDVGRATIAVLAMNDDDRIDQRRILLE
jgi:hypothetical protein